MSDEGRMTAAAERAEAGAVEAASAAETVKAEAIGRVVYSAAGRDKKRPFIIVGVNDDGTVDIADGALRTLAKPKRKNLRHLRITNALAPSGKLDDAAIREFLRSYEAGRDPSQSPDRP